MDRSEYFKNKLLEFEQKPNEEIVEFLKSYWQIDSLNPDDNSFKLIATYEKNSKVDKNGKSFGFFKNVRNLDGDLLYYPFNVDLLSYPFKREPVHVFATHNSKFEKEQYWLINVRLAPDYERIKHNNPFLLQLANMTVVKPSLNFADRLKKEELTRTIFRNTGATENDAINTAGSLRLIMADLYENEDDRFIYELLQNADDFPDNRGNVSVKIKLLDKHLVFAHSGRPFSERDVESICRINDSTKKSEENTIGYKGIGFKSVFSDNVETVFVNSGNFSFAFDKQSPVYKGENMDNIPWQIKPIWEEHYRLPKEIQDERVFFKMPVAFAINIGDEKERYDKAIMELLSASKFLLFLRHVNEISYTNGYNTIVLKKKDQDGRTIIKSNTENSCWITTRYIIPIPEDIRYELQTERAIPQKLKQVTSTEIIFAAEIKDNKIVCQQNTSIFSYLPTKVRDFKFPFVVNADFLTTASRESIHTKSVWNKFLFETIGEKCLHFIGTLHNYDDYLQLLVSNYISEDNALSTDFNESYRNALKEVPFVSNQNGLPTKQSEIIIDRTGLSKFIGAELFCKLIGTQKLLPSENISSSILENEILEEIEKVDFDKVISVITDNVFFNDWFITSSKEQKDLLFDWIKDNDISTRKDALKTFVSNIPLFHYGTEVKSYKEAMSLGYVVTTEHIIQIKDILNRLQIKCSDNVLDENHPLKDFVVAQDEKDLFDKITLCFIEQDGAGLSACQKMELFLALRKFSKIGPKHLSEIEFFNNSENQRRSLNEMCPYNESAPKWAESYMIAKEENYPELQEYLQKEFDVIWKNIDEIATEQEIPLDDIYFAYRWTDEKYTKDLIEKCKKTNNFENILSIVEDSRPETQVFFLQNTPRVDLYSNNTYNNDSYEYRVLQLALRVLENPSDFSSKIFFDGQCINEFSVSDDVVCEYIKNREKQTVKFSLATLLPQYKNQSDSIKKIKGLFKSKKDLDNFFVATPKSIYDVHCELNRLLDIPEARFSEWKGNGNAQQYLFATYYRRQKKGWNNLYVPQIDLTKESELFVHELLDFLYVNRISIEESPFTYHLKRYFDDKYFDSDYVFEKEQLLPIIEKWADDEKKKNYLKENGVRTEGSYAIQFRKLFLENSPISFIDKLEDEELASGVVFMATANGYARPFAGDNQSAFLLTIKEKKCCKLSDEWDEQKMEDQSDEWNAKEYNDWINTHYPYIFIYPGLFPRKLSYNGEVLLNYDDADSGYHYNKKSHKLFISSAQKLEDVLFRVAKEGKSDFDFDDYKFLCWGTDRISVSKDDMEEKDEQISSLIKDNQEKEELLKRYRAKYGNIDDDIEEDPNMLDHTVVSVAMGEIGTMSKDKQYDAQIEAQRFLMQTMKNWSYPEGYGEADEFYKPKHFSTVIIKDESGDSIPIVLKSYKKTSEPFKINTEEWDWIIKDGAKLLIYDGKDIKIHAPQDLIRNQANVSITFSTENLDIEDRISAFSDSLHYFNELHFDFDSFNISSKATSVKDICNTNIGVQHNLSDEEAL